MHQAGARTLGEFLYWQHRQRRPVRARNRSTGAKAEYDFYPTRQMLLDEFEAIWKIQSPHHAGMTKTAYETIHRAIFYQRPLAEPPVGKCSLDPAKDIGDADGFRCPWAHPLAQRFRIWQEVRNLAIAETGRPERPLSKEEGDRIALALFQNGRVSFDKLRSTLKLPPEARFNLEGEKRKELKGDETAAKLSQKSLFGKAWRSFSLERQIEIVAKLTDESDESELVSWLCESTTTDASKCKAIASAFLPDGHCRLGLRAIRKIVPFMAEAGLNYPEAAKAAGYDHALLPDGELSVTGYLPYYGEWLQDDVLGTGDPRDRSDKRWGRFPNPTVHIGLGQLRRVVNALIAEYGPPTEVTVEMTRSFKLSPRMLAEVEAEQAKNQRKNEDRAGNIRALGQEVNARNLLKLRLWEEQNPNDPMDRRCPYTGEVINIARLLSDEVDIDHLIPFSDSWDDSAANKIICMRYANRHKGNRTPYEAFGDNPEISGHRYNWDEISLRAAAIRGKAWRFGPEARQRYDRMGGFQARQLNETGWLARVAKSYLAAVTDPHKVHVLPGKLTAMIRSKWGLNDLLPDHNYSNAKNRKDHRHHAIDAVVAALTDRRLLHRMSSAYDDERQKIEIPLPWPDLRNDLEQKLKDIAVSHKPDHGVQGKLHEDTAYGSVAGDEAKEDGNLVYRKSFVALNEKEIGRIRDLRLRGLVQAHIDREKREGKDFKSALQSFGTQSPIPALKHGIRHVRLMKVEKPEYLVPIGDRSGRNYKSYSAGENAFVDVIELADGRWAGIATSVFDANQRKRKPSWETRHPDARFVMRVFKGDLLKLEVNGTRTTMVVHRLDAAANRFKLAAHNEAGNLDQRHADPEDPFRWLMASYNTLKAMKAERVRVDELGRVWRVLPDEAARNL